MILLRHLRNQLVRSTLPINSLYCFRLNYLVFIIIYYDLPTILISMSLYLKLFTGSFLPVITNFYFYIYFELCSHCLFMISNSIALLITVACGENLFFFFFIKFGVY